MKFSGSLVGFVSDSTGVAQMGASVQLFNRYERLLDRTLTNEKGAFGFDGLSPDLYSVRVTLASFMPAMKHNIRVQPGMRSFLAINLANVLSSIELVYAAPGASPLMSDDWKWVLRSAMATRPVLRIGPTTVDISDPERESRSESTIFSGTRGLVKLSAGDSSGSAAWANQPDLGTAFALATSVFGANHVQVSGNVGYSPANGIPSAGFHTSFRRDEMGPMSPEVRLTMRQLFLPARVGSAVTSGSQSGAPALRSMSATFADRMKLGDNLQVEYGFSLDSVTFLERLNYASPFARASYDLDGLGVLEFGFSSGAPPTDLLRPRGESETDLHHDIAALSVFPRVTLRDGRARVERTGNYEIGYRITVGSRTFNVAAYRESTSNAALTMAAPDGVYPTGDLLPDISSNSSIFNIGSYHRTGYTAAVTQSVGENLDVTVAVGDGGVLRTEQRALTSGDPDDLRRMIRRSQRPSVTGRIAGVIPAMGTRFYGSYQWTDYRSLTPGHTYLTQRTYPETGLNFSVRQPVRGIGGLPGRFEISAELRNLLAQGYLPIATGDGRTLLLIHTPRSVRGGLSFFF